MFDFLKKEKEVTGDVGLIEDLIQVVANLDCIEWHAQKSYDKTKDKKWLELKKIAREQRQKWASKFVKNDAENWCISSKHLPLVMIGFSEVADRFFNAGKIKESEEAYKDYGIWLGMLFVLNELK